MTVCHFSLIYSNIGLCREARNERQIDRPKKVLKCYRRDQTYRETKMLLLQKLMGLEWLSFAYKGYEEEDRHWFKGYHVYGSLDSVLKRFRVGEAMSCFRTSEGGDNLHVMFSSGKRFSIKYLTFEYRRTDFFKNEMGVHFCQFKVKKDMENHTVISSTTRDQILDKIDGYALMLPYKKKNNNFINQFTLVYHDWDVLVCDDCDNNVKGFPALSKFLFGDYYFERLYHY